MARSDAGSEPLDLRADPPAGVLSRVVARLSSFASRSAATSLDRFGSKRQNSGDEDARAAFFVWCVEDSGWLLSRRENVQLIEADLVERITLLEIDTGELERRALSTGLRLKELQRQVAAVVAWMNKTPDLEVGLVDAGGRALVAAGPRQVADSAVEVMVWLAKQISDAPLPAEVVALLHEIALRPSPVDDPRAELVDCIRGLNGSGTNAASQGGDKGLVWLEILKDPTFLAYLQNFARLRPVIVDLPVGTREVVSIVSDTRMEYGTAVPALKRLAQRLGFQPTTFLIDVVGLARVTQSGVQFRFSAPPGVSVTFAAFDGQVLRNEPEGDGAYRLQVMPDQVNARTALEKSAGRPARWIFVDVVAVPSVFVAPGLLISSVTAILLMAGALHLAWGGSFGDTQSTVAILLALPTAAAGVLATRDEHALLRRLLALPRRLLALTTVSAASAAVALAVKPPSIAFRLWWDSQIQVTLNTTAWVWAFASAYVLMVAVILGIAHARVTRSLRPPRVW